MPRMNEACAASAPLPGPRHPNATPGASAAGDAAPPPSIAEALVPQLQVLPPLFKELHRGSTCRNITMADQAKTLTIYCPETPAADV
ncbi:MAG: hypothetical protein LBU32_20470 [Clostridiales bacterium]|nr:hypothetical protein [Clostridiales bacterium]